MGRFLSESFPGMVLSADERARAPEADEISSPTALMFSSVCESSFWLISVNFQPPTASVPVGYRADTGLVFDAVRGYGWDAPLVSRDRNSQVPQALDTFVFSLLARTWELALPNGKYEVLVSVGDACCSQGPQRVIVEGATAINGKVTAAGEFVEKSAVVQVSDGRLTVQIGGAGGNTMLNQIVVASVP